MLREGALYTLAFCTLFLARMVNTLLTGAALRSCVILSPLFLPSFSFQSKGDFSPPFHVASFSTFSSHFLSGSLFPPRIPSALPSTRCPNCLTHSAPRDGAAIYRTYRSFYCTPFCIYLDSRSFLASMVQRTDENPRLVDEEFLSLASFCVTREIKRFVNPLYALVFIYPYIYGI